VVVQHCTAMQHDNNKGFVTVAVVVVPVVLILSVAIVTAVAVVSTVFHTRWTIL
jgi:cell division protein FtsL